MILITGASSGLGAALARRYANMGEQVVISGRDQARLASVAQSSSGLHPLSADLCNEQSVATLLDGVDAMSGASPLSTAIHCAGSGYFGPIAEQQADEITKLLQNNVTSSILLVRELVRRYRDTPLNLVVVMSTAAQQAKAGESTYCAAKWAVRGFIESVRLELKGKPMKIIAVYPGGMDTGFWPSSGKSLDTSSFMSAEEAAEMLQGALRATEHGHIADITIARG
ncbi:SDR family NAD(P)-dependent oxidoreductase [Shewanella sp. Isolate7]|uniref:SDR family NAD(P)-dependent oxidoreductase n=1 Tax=Shewanella sp. Isolate7 TaxID=2908528 RepID=UPI001EFE0EAF|nr:SDR family NAD(P)-dependent oxidoreductase [Shewanella sp. Isolate7]MCG9721118.1 SDR family NAD(P)-dependent oxidoreductase [Shewanella sp. Isolate7]